MINQAFKRPFWSSHNEHTTNWLSVIYVGKLRIKIDNEIILTGMWKHLLMKTDNKTNTSKISWTLSIFDSSSSTDIKKNSIFMSSLFIYYCIIWTMSMHLFKFHHMLLEVQGMQLLWIFLIIWQIKFLYKFPWSKIWRLMNYWNTACGIATS